MTTTSANSDNALSLSWHDSAWVPILNPTNVMDYFSERSNPFYDRTCNNEVIKMQRQSHEQLNNMTGLEYVLLHVQDPILYVVRKQHRHSPTQVTPLADYYIIDGCVYQAPDLGSVINSRMLNLTSGLLSAFEEAQSYSRYHPSRGYWWEFKDQDQTDQQGKDKKKHKEEPGSYFQRHRVDVLLEELSKKFPLKCSQTPGQPEKPEEQPKVEPKVEVKTEKTEERRNADSSKPPPEKKPKLR